MPIVRCLSRLSAPGGGYETGMPESNDPRRTQESDQLPEEQPATGGGTTDPDERKTQVGLDPDVDPGSRRNTGNPHDHDNG